MKIYRLIDGYLVFIMLMLAQPILALASQSDEMNPIYDIDSDLRRECRSAPLLVGLGQSDITGPIAEAALNGYGDIGHRSEGLHMRLRSRAFIFQNACQSRIMALVLNDLAMVFNSLKSEILAKVNKTLPGVFHHENLLLSATHTHAGHGGYGYHTLYNLPTLGFNHQAHQAIVDGTAEAIVAAYFNQRPMSLQVKEGRLRQAGFNRSLDAYHRNPEFEQLAYEDDVDTSKLVLSLRDEQGQLRGLLDWFPVHPVYLPLENKLVSGDNKGLAAYQVERRYGVRYLSQQPEFLAGFFQANSGDISPYEIDAPPTDRNQYFKDLEYNAALQSRRALELVEQSRFSLGRDIDYIHMYVDLDKVSLRSEFRFSETQLKTCPGALGVAFAAGTENGQPVPIFKEGTIYGKNWPEITLLPDLQDCHAEKVILLPTGLFEPSWTPHILPFQIIRIGQLAIVAAPFEITSMAGRRLKSTILRELAPYGIRWVALTGLANEYAHYVTTPEEYAEQNYEGGSTLFGPNSLGAYTQIFVDLARKMAIGDHPAQVLTPPDLSDQDLELLPGVVLDRPPRGREFGEQANQLQKSYQIGAIVKAEFWGAHPKNDLKRNQSYLIIERKESAGWIPMLYDWDHETLMRWDRKGLAKSLITIEWFTRPETLPGVYRICHFGASRNLLGKVSDYQGCSDSFEIQ